jgi:hypothetical protein
MIQPPRNKTTHGVNESSRDRDRPLSPAAGVQGVAQAVPDEVHRENGEGYSDTWEDNGVLALDEDAEPAAEGVGEHRAPLWRWGAGAQSEERERCHVEDRSRERQGGLHDEGRCAIGQDAGENDLGVARPQGLFGFDVVTFPDALPNASGMTHRACQNGIETRRSSLGLRH